MPRNSLFLAILKTDNTFKQISFRGRTVWQGKCFYCNRKLIVETDGAPYSDISIEHIIPQSHGGTNALENLALCCPRCNHQKGYRVDARRSGDQRLTQTLQKFVEQRRARWRKSY